MATIPTPTLALQKHYDWGLRAIKSVLVVAGSLLRAEAGQVESDVLFRALRDFNIPKILAQVDTALYKHYTASNRKPGQEPQILFSWGVSSIVHFCYLHVCPTCCTPGHGDLHGSPE
jgi:hypothetical protein